ncbi:MAG: helix-turn-helix transcriptional regulator [Acholeplasmatales bacterium]|nr:helix-turn-helix transcriptional regulator [Acholeplasmatales bacterium]
MSELSKYLEDNLKLIQFEDTDDSDENLLLKISKMIIEARNSTGITQKELSLRTNIQQATISKIESGNYNLTINMLERIAEGLGKEIIIKFE